MFFKATSAGLVAILLLPSIAMASRPSGFPRFFERDGLTCVQTLTAESKVVETCRPTDRQPQVPEFKEVELGASLPYRNGWSTNPAATARRHAASHGDTSRFGTGFALGMFLGLIGTVIAGVVAGNSSVDTPPPHPEYTGGEAFAYQRAYADEVRSSRTGSAVVGGLVGTAVTVGLIVLVVSQSDNGVR